MRKIGLLNLKWSDYERDSGRVYFYEKNKRKITDKVLGDDRVRLLQSISRGEREYIFSGPEGTP